MTAYHRVRELLEELGAELAWEGDAGGVPISRWTLRGRSLLVTQEAAGVRLFEASLPRGRFTTDHVLDAIAQLADMKEEARATATRSG